MISDDKKLELRHKMWELARDVLTVRANSRAAMPDLTDEEYAYAREFLLGIAKSTAPGNYCEPDDDEDEFWCETCGESIPESHYHCAECGEVCSMAGHPACIDAARKSDG